MYVMPLSKIAQKFFCNLKGVGHLNFDKNIRDLRGKARQVDLIYLKGLSHEKDFKNVGQTLKNLT